MLLTVALEQIKGRGPVFALPLYKILQSVDAIHMNSSNSFTNTRQQSVQVCHHQCPALCPGVTESHKL